jgi:hypothetical protein
VQEKSRGEYTRTSFRLAGPLTTAFGSQDEGLQGVRSEENCPEGFNVWLTLALSARAAAPPPMKPTFRK